MYRHYRALLDLAAAAAPPGSASLNGKFEERHARVNWLDIHKG